MTNDIVFRNGIFLPSASVFGSDAIAIRHSRRPRRNSSPTFGKKSLNVSENNID